MIKFYTEIILPYIVTLFRSLESFRLLQYMSSICDLTFPQINYYLFSFSFFSRGLITFSLLAVDAGLAQCSDDNVMYFQVELRKWCIGDCCTDDAGKGARKATSMVSLRMGLGTRFPRSRSEK